MTRYAAAALKVLTGFAVFLAVWQLVSWSGWVRPGLLATPAQTLGAISKVFGQGSAWQDLGATLLRVVAGLAISVALGLPLGLLVGYLRFLHQISSGLLDFLRSIPPVVLYPLAILFFDPQRYATYSLVVFGCTTVIILHAAVGAYNMPKFRSEVARVLGGTRVQVFWNVVVFETLPQIVVGIRVAMSLAVIIVVVSEMFLGFGGTTASMGLGMRLHDSMTVFRTAEIYAYILLIGAIGFAINRLAVLGERLLVHWTR